MEHVSDDTSPAAHRDTSQERAVIEQLDGLTQRLRDLLQLEDGWDSYGGISPRRHLLEAGLRFVEPLLSVDIAPPHVVPTSRGGIQFEWHVGGRELEIEVVGPDRFELFFEDEGTGELVEKQVASRHLGQVVELVNRLKVAPESRDASVPAIRDASLSDGGDGTGATCPPSRRETRQCRWCGEPIPATMRPDSLACSKRCRQAAWRFRRGCQARERAVLPLCLAYADPPYPGLSRRYYSDHPDYAGEVDHGALLSRLQKYDGWALSTSARALPEILALCVAQDLDVRVAAWFRGARGAKSAWPLSSWEPVVYAGGRRVVSDQPGRDALQHVSRPRLTDPNRVIGAKPAAFCYWMFDLLGARPGDSLNDLFPGSGGVGRAWGVFSGAA